MSKYLDITGLSHLWDKIKAKFAPKTEGIPFIISTTTTAGVWTGNAPFDTLQSGQSIKYWTSHTGVSGQQTTLELTLADGETTTGAIPVYYRGTTILTNHVGANNCCMLTYRENVTIGDDTITRGWWLDFAYYKDTTTDTYDRTLVTNFKPTATGKIIYARQLVFQMSDGTYKSITNSNSTNTAHTACTDKANGLGIINPQAVHFYNNATNVAVGKACGAYMYSAISAFDLRYSSNCGSTLVAKKPVYLVFTFEDGKFYLDDENEWYSQEIPRTANEEEGKYVYLFLGYAYSTYQSSLAIEKPLLVYKDGKIQPFIGDVSDGQDGQDGQDGKSAFEIAVENGYKGKYNLSGFRNDPYQMQEWEIEEMIQSEGQFEVGTTESISAGDVLLVRPSFIDSSHSQSGYYIIGTVLSYDDVDRLLVFDSSQPYEIGDMSGHYSFETDDIIENTDVMGKMSEADWLESMTNHDELYDYACNNNLYLGTYTVTTSADLNDASDYDIEYSIQNDVEFEVAYGSTGAVVLITPTAGENGVYIIGTIKSFRHETNPIRRYATIDACLPYTVGNYYDGDDKDHIMANSRIHGVRDKDYWNEWAVKAILAQAE